MCVATLMSVTFDCPDPDLLASFYRRLLGLQEAGAARERAAIAWRGAGCLISFLRVQTHRPPTWPDGLQQQQIHLDVATSDLEPTSRGLSIWARSQLSISHGRIGGAS